MLGPVFHQELVTSARRARYFLWRVLYAGLLLVVLLFVYLLSYAMTGSWSYQIAAVFARQYLQSFAVLQLGAVMLLGPAMAAGAIARERERRTIEYLFTTHLSSAQIVLEKLAAAISQLSLAVMAGIPVLAIAMLLGGITSGELFDVSLVTFSTLVAVTSISLAASTICRRAREAVSMTYALLFIVMLGPVLLAGLTRGSVLATPALQVSEAIQLINPLSVMLLVLDPGSTPDAVRSALWWMCSIHLTVSLVLVSLCAWGLRRVALHAGSPIRPRSANRRWSRLHYDLGSRPLIWKEMFASRNHSRLARLGRGVLVALVGLAMLGTLWQFIDCGTSNRWPAFGGFALFMSGVLESISVLLAPPGPPIPSPRNANAKPG
jgi:ABC-type transport system involved in multi-copper enzyme maturation permease subunit